MGAKIKGARRESSKKKKKKIRGKINIVDARGGLSYPPDHPLENVVRLVFFSLTLLWMFIPVPCAPSFFAKPRRSSAPFGAVHPPCLQQPVTGVGFHAGKILCLGFLLH